MKYRKKPVVIEAMQFTGDNFNEVYRWGLESDRDIGNKFFESRQHMNMGVNTLEGMMTALPGDWIIKGIKGEFYPCKPDVFEATYEPIAECPPHDWSQDGERCSKCGTKDWMTRSLFTITVTYGSRAFGFALVGRIKT